MSAFRNNPHPRNVSGVTFSPLGEADLRLIRQHCDWFDRDGATEASVESRRDNIRRLAEWLPCPLLEATPTLLDEWQSDLRKRRNRRNGGPLADNTIATYSAHVRSFYRWAHENDRVETNPAARLPRIRRPRGQAHPIPEQHLITALSLAAEPMRTWLLLAAFMGLRCFEIAGLRRDNVHEIEGRLVIAGVGKGRKPFRLTVPLYVEPALRSHLVGHGPLFRTPRGLPLTGHAVSRLTTRFFDRIGMSTYTMHWARHSFGSATYQATKDLLLTQDLMRHASSDMTRIYVLTTRPEGVRAMDKVARQALAKKKPRQMQRSAAPAA